MERHLWSWHSPSLSREMPTAMWGHSGVPLLLFPTAGGDFLECERFLMVRALEPLIHAGRIRVFACDGVTSDGWLNPDAPPWHKTWLQARFDDYVQHELLPHIERISGRQGIIATGASLGAYNAVNSVTKHPSWFSMCIAMSGTYWFERWMGGHWDENFYFNMPVSFLPDLNGAALQSLQRTQFVLATGQGEAEAPWETEHLGGLLQSKGVPTNIEIWGHDVKHDWPTWRTMLPLFLDKLVH